MPNIKRKQIAFNLDDPFQRKLYEYVNSVSTNFSSYGKHLILKDMSDNWSNGNVEVIQDGPTIDSDIIKGFI